MLYRFARAFIALTLAAFAFAPSVAAAQTTQQITVTLNEFTLTPSTFTVTQGVPVEFTVINAGKINHNIELEFPDNIINKVLFSSNLTPGQKATATYTFSRTGAWQIYCPVGSHESMGMAGTIQVVAAATMPATGGLPIPLHSLVMLLGMLAIAVIGGGWMLMQSGRRRGL